MTTSQPWYQVEVSRASMVRANVRAGFRFLWSAILIAVRGVK